MLSFSDRYVALSAVASFLFGYQIAVFNTTINFPVLDFEICGNGWQTKCDAVSGTTTWAVTAVFVGAAFGSFIAGRIVTFGRRNALFLCHLISVAGSLTAALAPNFGVLIATRAVVGLCIGIITVAAPMFISEICAAQSRGSRGVVHQLMITIGIFVAVLLGLVLVQPPGDDPTYVISAFEKVYYRGMLLAPGCVSVICLGLMCTKYGDDTPMSLLEGGNSKEALEVLCKIYVNVDDAEERFEELTQTMAESSGSDGSVSLWKVLQTPSYFKILGIGLVLSAGQQISGINAFVALSTNIFARAGVGAWATWASTGMALVNVIATFPAMLLIDSLGRRPLMLLGTAGQTISLAIVPIAALVSSSPDTVATASVIAVISYIVFFSIAQGPVVWVYLFEMFPSEMNSAGSSAASALNWLTGCAIVFITSWLTDEKWVVPQFIFFTVTCGLTLIFLFIFMKETKGTTVSPYSIGNRATATVDEEAALIKQV